MKDYKGYKLLDKIMLVCQDKFKDREYYFAYLVDPSSKSQIESARHWAKITEYGPSVKNPETGRWENEYKIDHEPVEFTFDNEGFTFELLENAHGSSQGGKLAFWNCLITKDDNVFKIGINSDLLLEVLKSGTFIKGKCQEPVRFASRSGKVGVVVEGSKELEAAKLDMELKKVMKKKTTRYNIGDNICTLTQDDIYLGEWFYNYELKYVGGKYRISSCYADTHQLHVYKNPRSCHLSIPRSYLPKEGTLKSVFEQCDGWRYGVSDKKPARFLGENSAPVDIIIDEMCCLFKSKFTSWSEAVEKESYMGKGSDGSILQYMNNDKFGLYIGKENAFKLDERFLEVVRRQGIKIIEED